MGTKQTKKIKYDTFYVAIVDKIFMNGISYNKLINMRHYQDDIFIQSTNRIYYCNVVYKPNVGLLYKCYNNRHYRGLIHDEELKKLMTYIKKYRKKFGINI